ncbi:uroporphyrinogen-III C-methyltransferase [Opitutaceae bacterium TAV4]|nr:uroporphyrinogen-III C-methyltransferase [Opitutaceae bacterium TAV4]RRK01849.1 uroporphyrinogen-III C-methyltransferase [Opitutaceae bacterium TAV3]
MTDQATTTKSTKPISATGTVYLVGAGPGDLGLVTFRAKELISTADVLVYDYLVHPELVKWCRPECQIIYVGKKAGFHSVPQTEIEKILVEHARAGRRVVRLKGGDPFVFGRGGEEARTLAAHDIPFEVVPGVTAALAAGAYAGIPLTHRNSNSAVLLLTGHEDVEKHQLALDWRAYGALKNTTLAIYMGMGRLRQIMDELQAGGLAPDTPAAVVQWASLGRQRSVVATAATLADRVAEAGLASPAIIFVGETVRQHETIDWFERLPLFGRRVAITRTRDQNSELREKLEALGAEVIELPLITISKDVDKHGLVEILTELGSYDWIVFTSANGVRFFFEEFFKGFDDVRALGLLRFACVGRATAREIEKHHIKVECMPASATGESLADALIETDSLDSAKVIVVTGNLNRDILVKKLEAANAIVDRLLLYKTERTDLTNDPVADDFRQRGADAILFASSSAVQSFAKHAAALQLAPAARHPLTGSIGVLTSATMRESGMKVDFEAGKPSLDSLIAAMQKRLAE